MAVFTNPSGEVRCLPEDILDFTYQGKIIDITLLPGEYIFSCWGASGYNSYGGGAFTSGKLKFIEPKQFFIVVGGQGNNTSAAATSAGYNGGGKGNVGEQHSSYIGGGGASDIRLIGGATWSDITSLRSRIMVAAGAGGSGSVNYGAAGGALSGIWGTDSPQWAGYAGTGATQTSGGSEMSAGNRNPSGWNAGGFGYGGTNTRNRGKEGTYGGAGGGAGWYGGGPSFRSHAGAGGGSSFISGHTGCNAVDSNGKHLGKTYFDSNFIFTETNMVAGNVSQVQPDGSYSTGHKGNGHIQIVCKRLFRRALVNFNGVPVHWNTVENKWETINIELET